MLVVHGFWSPDDDLCLWAEDSERTVKSPSQAMRSARPHPFAAPAEALTEVHPGKPGEATLLLPSLRSAPLDSPELVRVVPRPPARTAPALLQWTVPVVTVDAAAAVDILSEHAEGVRYGASLHYLAELALFADELVARGRVLPTVDRDSVGPLARWRPLLQGQDVVSVHGLVGAMPPVCRAAPGREDPHDLVTTALDALVDATVRRSLPASHRIAPARRGRRPRQLPVVEAWLEALTSPDGRFDADDADVDTLVEALRPWDEVGAGPTGPARATFRLTEVTDDPQDPHGSNGDTPGVGSADARDSADPHRRSDVAGKTAAPDAADPHGSTRNTAGGGRVVRDLARDTANTRDMAGSASAGATAGITGGRDTVASDTATRDSDTVGVDPVNPHAPTRNTAAGGTGAGASAADSRWRLEFLLQSAEDPSLLLPAAQAWSDDGSLSRWLEQPQELLLAELGRASLVYPELAAGLRQARPCGLDLDTDGALRFLSTGAPALDDAGFGVLLPSWWDRRQALGLKLSAQTPTDGVVDGASRFGRDQLMQFRWDLAVGDDTLTEDEIAALAETKAPLVRLRGQWVVVDPDQLERGLAFLKRAGTGEKTAGEILALAASHPDDVDSPLPLTSVAADGWLGDLLDGSAMHSLEPVAPPDGFQAELRPYQQRGLSWLAFLSSLGLGACLADDMGLGKTVQLLALESAHRATTPDVGPTLLICPMSLVGNWQREAAKFAPDLAVYAHHGPQRLRGAELSDALPDADLMLTTYATATRDIDELAEITWPRVVLDEAQAIKNSLSQAAKAVRRLPAEHRVALTGTPVENRLAELWSIMEFLNPGMLGSAELFRTRYAIPVERHRAAAPAERLRAITRPYVLRRLKTDPAIVDDLPDKIEMKQYCQLTTEQAALYRSVLSEMMAKIDRSEGIERRGNVLAAMAKLKQVCNHPALLLHDRSAIGRRSGKVIRLEEIVEEIVAAGDKVLCFTQFTEFAEMLLPHLAARFDSDVAYLHGGTTRKRRDEVVTQFQSDGGPPIFLLSLKAGGTGLNLTAANHVIHLDRWWNPAVENQATDRAFRIGQTRNVQVRKLICTGTLEEKIDEMIEDKKALADLVIRDGEGWLTELSTSDLRDVFALSKEAVDE